MARPLRLDIPGALYHITARGNARGPIYRDDHDRAAFLTLLGATCKQYGWTVHAYCLMTNHYHLLLALQEAPDGRLVRGMQHLNSRSAQLFNQRHRRVGHLYQGRYHAILVQRERHLVELTRYVVLNPVRAGIVADAAEWPWSSYRATVGLASAPAWLCAEAIITPFGTGDQGRQAYINFVAGGMRESSYWSQTSHQIYLGDQSFIARARKQGMTRATDAEIPTAQRGVPARPVIGSMLARAHRDAAIVTAYAAGRETLKTLGTRYGLHYSQISRILQRAAQDARGDSARDAMGDSSGDAAPLTSE
jgi:putative transposase